MNDLERLEALETQLARLIDDNARAPILVEGMRDERALRALGCEGQVVLINTGHSLLATAEALAAEHVRVILLMDWDRTGGRLTRRLDETLTLHGVRCDHEHRRTMAMLTGRDCSTVEELPGFVARLRSRVGEPAARRAGIRRAGRSDDPHPDSHR